MSKLTHKQKIKLARKMLTKAELRQRVPIFESVAWEHRRDTNFLKEATRIQEARERRKDV